MNILYWVVFNDEDVHCSLLKALNCYDEDIAVFYDEDIALMYDKDMALFYVRTLHRVCWGHCIVLS